MMQPIRQPKLKTGSPGDTAARLERELTLLARWLEANSRARPAPLARAHYLLLLRLAEGAAPVGMLAAGLGLDGTTVTRQVAAMESHGLVRKLANPADGRSALVERTAKGAAIADAMQRERRERVAGRFARWSEADRAELAGWLARVNALLAQDDPAARS
jgi:DNA-binding MarR family transcriptional regulator